MRRWLTGCARPSIADPFIPVKIADHQRERSEFANLLRDRIASLKNEPATREDFLKEMQRFLPAVTGRETLGQPAWWSYLVSVLEDQARVVEAYEAAGILAEVQPFFSIFSFY